MKILQISNYYKPHIGGIEQTAHDISDALLNTYETKVVCFSEDKEDKVENIDGVEVYKCGFFKKVASQALSFSYGKILKKVMNNFKPDIVIFHFPNPFVAHYLLKYKKRKFKLVVWYHADITKQKVLGKFFIKQTKKILERANVVVATSPIYKNNSTNLRAISNKVQVIPSCINEQRLILTPEIISKSEELKNKYNNKTLIFAIGRHVEYKGLKYLVEAAKYLDNNYQVIIGGQGPLTCELKEQAKNLKNVEFIGKISDEDMVAYLNSSDIYAFPSITKNEAFGLSLAEAMYFGKPAITFTILGSGVNYVSLNNVTGLECPNKDAKAFADAIKQLASDTNLRKTLGINARNRVIENFTFKQFKDNTIRLIEMLK